jgi:hypothetical protein
MYFFDKAMKDLQKNDKTDWMREAQGMWYIEDYMDFMQMLQTLDVSESTQYDSENFWKYSADQQFQMHHCTP